MDDRGQNDIRKRTALERCHDALFGPEGEPSEGLVIQFRDLLKDVRPIINLYTGVKWPLALIVVGLLSAFGGWLLSLARMFLGGGQP